MANFVRRVNMEPIGAGRARKLVCHLFIVDDGDRPVVDPYTDNPRLEQAVLVAALGFIPNANGERLAVSFDIERDGDDDILTRFDVFAVKPDSRRARPGNRRTKKPTG